MSSAVPEKMDPQAKFEFTFSLDSNLRVHPPYNPDLILPPVTFGFSKLIEQLAGRKFTELQDLSKMVRHFRVERVARTARNLCGQLRDVV